MAVIFTTLIVAIAVLWTARIAANILSFTHLWWVKEYRFDRMMIHLRTPQGKRVYVLPLKRPPFSPRSIAIMGFTALFLALAYLLLPIPMLGRLFVLDAISFPLTFIAVQLLSLPVVLYHRYEIARARAALSDAKVPAIGITGSYGKTSTKEYLSAITSTAMRTLKTEASKNSPIGISEVVLSHTLSSYDLFIVEMGAYKPGEIAMMSSLVAPEVGIITAINPQHQDLFGSIERTMAAKFELLEGLVGKRIAVMNMDDANVRIMASWAKAKGITVWGYTRKGEKSDIVSRMFTAEKCTSTLSGISFTAGDGGKKYAVKAPVIGEHQVSNILAAIAGAVACGMSFDSAAKAAAKVHPAKKVLEFGSGTHGATFIDDTFNNNPDAAIAAIDVLAKQPGKKILVFQPMIELGSFADSSHQRVGKHAGAVCDEIILTNANWHAPFVHGVREASRTVPVTVMAKDKAVSHLKKVIRKSDTVLFKGKEAGLILDKLPRI
jgi:UDP-N-acetylmuramoyl-tripeptide--D-alanyl-D-alanine ligase